MQQLVFDFFKLCGLEPLEIRKGVWQVQVDDTLMKELDGWRAQGRLLQFTFDKGSAELYGADLICPGSYRLNSILQVIRKQGILSQAYVPLHHFHEPSVRKKILARSSAQERVYVVSCSLHYTQYLQLEILAEARGLQKTESLHTVTVDLSSGKVLKYAFPHYLLEPGGVPRDQVCRRKCGLKQAFSNAAAYLYDQFAEKSLPWAVEAKEKLLLEEAKLRDFFAGRTDSEEFEAKKKELHQRLAPVLRLDALRGAILFIPLFRYGLVVVAPDGKEKSRTISYDPVGNMYLQELD